ncbi:MAG: ATP-grasp domain-containing protein [Clostridia bacterium]|nr:ATP-grasp domain-containing protein [Clostridia bacterium]
MKNKKIMTKKILIIGAGFLQDFVIKKAKQIGYKVYAVDGDENAIGFLSADEHAVISIVDKEKCLEYAIKNEVDGVITAATDYGVLTAAYIAEKMGLRGIKYSVAELVKNKFETRKRLCVIENDKNARIIGKGENIDFIAEQLQFPVIVKPADGSGSRATTRVDLATELKNACEFAIKESRIEKAIVETFFTGNEYGAESLVVNGKVHVLGIMRKIMTNPPYYAELGHCMPSGLNRRIENRAKKHVKKAIKALGISFGSVNMDMIIDEYGKIHIVDVGARMGGNMIGPCVIPYGTGIAYVENMIKNAVGEKVRLKKHAHKAVATRLLAFKGGKVVAIPDFKAIEKKYNVEIFEHISLGQTVNEYHTNLDGCGYVVAKADTVEKAERNAQNAFVEIEKVIFGNRK